MKGEKKIIAYCILPYRVLIPVWSILLLFVCSATLSAQEKKDSLVIKTDSTLALAEIKTDSTAIIPKKDSTKKRAFSPRGAAIRSAILPGWGQVYNRKYWKVPIVYAALGITGYVFFDNLNTYKESRFAYSARYKAQLPIPDSTDYKTLEPLYQKVSIESIKSQRDRFRQYLDYSVLFFVVFWGLNVVDATVDAHLKGFDVSPDLTLRIKPGHSAMAGTNGISLVLSFRDRHGK